MKNGEEKGKRKQTGMKIIWKKKEENVSWRDEKKKKTMKREGKRNKGKKIKETKNKDDKTIQKQQG